MEVIVLTWLDRARGWGADPNSSRIQALPGYCDGAALRVDRWREHGLSLLGQAGEGDVDDS